MNSTDEQDHGALLGLEAWGFRQWNTLDTTMAQFAAALQV